jgi:hypothetical protein
MNAFTMPYSEFLPLKEHIYTHTPHPSLSSTSYHALSPVHHISRTPRTSVLPYTVDTHSISLHSLPAPFRAPPSPLTFTPLVESHTQVSVTTPACSSPSTSASFFFFKCGKSIANTKILTMTNMAVAEMNTMRRLREYASITAVKEGLVRGCVGDLES